MSDSEIIGYVCPICDTPNPMVAKYCVKCGHWLLDTASAYTAKPITRNGLKWYFPGNDSNSHGQKKGWLGLILELTAVFAVVILVISLLVWTWHSSPSKNSISQIPASVFPTSSPTQNSPVVQIPSQPSQSTNESDMELSDFQLILDKPNQYVECSVKNITQYQFSIVNATVRFFGDSGTQIGSISTSTTNLKAGETWKLKEQVIYTGIKNMDIHVTGNYNPI